MAALSLAQGLEIPAGPSSSQELAPPDSPLFMALATWVWDVSSTLEPFNGIWVKHQFMDYGWVEKATCPSLEYKQTNKTKVNKEK